MRQMTSVLTSVLTSDDPYPGYTTPGTPTPLQHEAELHQKDLRIIAEFLHISDVRNSGILRADMFLALSLIVGFWVSDGSNSGRRVDIPVIRPCKVYKKDSFDGFDCFNCFMDI